MASGYERVNVHDDDDNRHHVDNHVVPNSPPPSFHSRASSPHRRNQVDPDLADAFDDDDDDHSDDEVDDRQRLIRQNAGASSLDDSTTSSDISSPSSRPAPPPPTIATSSGRVVGGGNGTDGVFANMSARPERHDSAEKDELPPSYEQAAADAAPPYWETTILAPGMGGPDEVYVEGLPVGSIFSFAWNGMISVAFTLPGFLLTYLLHSTHAAKNGSRAGLGITLINYGLSMQGFTDGGDGPPQMNGPDGYAAPADPNSHNFDAGDINGDPDSNDSITSSEWVSYLLMIVGWFLLIKSVAEYLRVRRHEQLVLQSPDRGLGVPVVAEGERNETIV